MFAILGATGNVGQATAARLRAAGEPVRVIVREPAKAARLKEIGCDVAVADLSDAESLMAVLRDVGAVQVILPVRPGCVDPARDMRQSMANIALTLSAVRPARILAISDYGAHIPGDIGMPGMFREFEASLRPMAGRKLALRSAEHVHNWMRVAPAAIRSGTLPTFQSPTHMLQPMIAARDLGIIAADLLRRSADWPEWSVVHAEGPSRYSADEVASTIGALARRDVVAQSVPRSQWSAALGHLPPTLADLLMKANNAKNRGGLVDAEPIAADIRYGTTHLMDALRQSLDIR